MSDRRIDLTLDAAPDSPAKARRAVGGLTDAGVPPQRLEDVRLLVSELVTNAFRHGGGTSIGFSAWTEGRALHVEVRDQGPGFSPNGRPAPVGGAVSGYGLVLVERLADRWGVDDTGQTRVWFQVDA